MGYYINTSDNLQKGQKLIEKYDAKPITRPKNFSDIPENKALIVIISNGMFEAAGYILTKKSLKDLQYQKTQDRKHSY